MLFKKPSEEKIEPTQHELFENAQARIKQKRRLFTHLVVFLAGSIFLLVLNKGFKIAPANNWFLWAISGWFFLWVIHFLNVFVTNNVLGKKWERAQREKLVAYQKRKLEQLKAEVEKEALNQKNDTQTQ